VNLPGILPRRGRTRLQQEKDEPTRGTGQSGTAENPLDGAALSLAGNALAGEWSSVGVGILSRCAVATGCSLSLRVDE
jgi:hypothetical protein